MSNIEKYNEAFISTFDVDSSQLNNSLSKDTVPNWDSVRQLALVSKLEDAFDVFFDTEDLIQMISYSRGIEILKKYDIQL